MRKVILILFLTILVAACNSTKQDNNSLSSTESRSEADSLINIFFGNDTSIINSLGQNLYGNNIYLLFSKDRPNGYEISIYYRDNYASDDLFIWHFKKGEDLNCYIKTHAIPRDLETELYIYHENNYPVNQDVKMIFYTNFSEHIPIKQDVEWYFAFVDVDFDGEEEFVVEHDAYYLYNHYYACFDLDDSNKTAYRGFLSPMNDGPYNYLTQGTRGRTKIDHEKKEIHIIKTSGNAYITETLAKKIGNKVKIVEQIEYVNHSHSSEKSKTTYKLQNDSLIEVAYETIEDETFFKNLCEEYSLEYSFD